MLLVSKSLISRMLEDGSGIIANTPSITRFAAGGSASSTMGPKVAIDDTLSNFGIRVTELPATPERVKRWIAESENS